MSLEPFLAIIPQTLRQDLESQDFIDSLIRWLELAKNEINTNESFLQNNETVNNNFFDLSTTTSSTESPTTSTSGNDQVGTVEVNGTTVELLDRQTANVRNGGRVNLDSNPPKNYRVEVRNSDGSNVVISGNGKAINGQNSISIQTQFTVRVIQYFIDTNDFGVI